MPTNIQGLNLVQPHQASTDAQDLLSGQAFPDISAQLDLWTNLSFETDEGALPRNDDDKQRQSLAEEDDDDTKSPITASGEKAVHDGHVNVVTATNLGTNLPQPASQSPAVPHLPVFDINSFLSGFGIDPFSTLPQQHNPGAIAPSLAQLLALHSHAPTFSAPTSPFTHYPAQSVAAYPPLPQLAPTTPAPPPLVHAPLPTPVTSNTAAEEPPAKRSRVHKTSVSTPASPEGLSPDASNMGIAAAEDKRRRNTAASARFRLKKKEREAALEGKAKELESRVNELERECEGLRRENGWLKGLVVGVTGAAQAPVVTGPPPALSAPQLASLTNPSPGVP